MASARKVRQIRPNAAPNDKLDAYLGRLRQLAGDGERSNVAMMELLMELYEHKEIWGARYSAWDDLLKEEGFTTPYTYEGFVKAFNDFGRSEVTTLGVRASVLLVRLPKGTRTKVHGMLEQWMKTHPVPPTYQRVSTYVKIVIGNLNGPKKGLSKDETITGLRSAKRALSTENRTLKATTERLRKHIWRLNGMLKRAGLEVPKVPDLGTEV